MRAGASAGRLPAMRVRGGALAGLFVLSAAVCGCSGSSGSTAAPPVTTIAIATEPTSPPVASSAPSSTLAVVSTTTAASVPLVPVLVRVAPKNDAEREVIEALKVLLAIDYGARGNRLPSLDVLDDAYTSDLRMAVEKQARNVRSGLLSEPGSIDRFVVGDLRMTTQADATVEVCYVNNGRLVATNENASTTSILDSSIVTRELTYQLVRLSVGWRIRNVALRVKTAGADRCAH